MPATYEIDPANRRVTATLTGHLTVAEAVGLLSALVEDPRFGTGLDGLIDASHVSRIDLMGIDIHRMAELARRADEKWRGSRWAVVARSTVVFGLARMYQTIRSDAPYRIEVFRTLADAEAWLAATG